MKSNVHKIYISIKASIPLSNPQFQKLKNKPTLKPIAYSVKAIPLQYIPLLLLRMEPSVPRTAKAKSGLTSRVSKIGGIIFLNKFK
ncbi:hypothetical protein OIU76_008460 [Salix suchowensis]|nr:hypothetical protein OIU76_008460 [Salix suchowensis]